MRQLTRSAQAAQQIRKILKENFSGIKFKVRSDNFAGGNSCNVSWTDGPIREEVNDLISQYKYGHFDGMQDMYS